MAAAVLACLPCLAPALAQDPTPPTGGAEMSLSMDQALTVGRDKSFRLRRSARSNEISKLSIQNVKSQYWPHVDVSLNANEAERGATYYNHGYSGVTNPYSTFQGNATASAYMNVDLFGTLGHQVKQAEYSNENSALDMKQASIDVTMTVRTSYIDALRAQGDVDADEQLVSELQDLLNSVRAGSPAVVNFLRVELANAQQMLANSRTSADIAQNSLKQLLQLLPETRLKLTTKLDPAVPAVDRNSLLNQALVNRPDIREAQIRLLQARLSMEQVRDSRKPSVSVYAYYNGSLIGSGPIDMYNSRYQSGAVILNVNIPLWYWDHGVMDNSERMALLNTEQAQDDILEQNQRVALEIRQLIINLDQAQRKLASLPNPEIAHEGLMQAERSLLAHGAGPAQLAQVSNARNTWRLTQTASINALADYYSALYQLKRSIGEE
jgi:outer membrane protein TolC